MLLPGHLASLYIISQLPSLYGKPLATTDQVFVILTGYVLDLDLLITNKKGAANHHLLPTPYTSLCGFTFWNFNRSF